MHPFIRRSYANFARIRAWRTPRSVWKSTRRTPRSDWAEQEEERWLFANRSWLVWAGWEV